MKKNTLYLLLLTTICSIQLSISQCDLPIQYSGNTGSNMTVFFTSGAIEALPIASDSPYIVALSPDGLIVGSASVATADLIGGQQSLAVWGDDTATPELDGASAGQALTFQLVDGTVLYDLDLSFAGLNSFTANGQLPVIAASFELNCTAILGCTDPTSSNYNQDATSDDGSCIPVVFGCTDMTASNYNPEANADDDSCTASCDPWFTHTQISSSDANMSAVLDTDFTSSLNLPSVPNISVEDFVSPSPTGINHTVLITNDIFSSYVGGQLGAFYDLNQDGNLQCVGLADINSGFFSVPLWGDDTFTDETDGLLTGDVPEFIILFENEIIYVEEIPEFTGYENNGIGTIGEANIYLPTSPYVVAVNANNTVVGSVNVFNDLQSELIIYSDDTESNQSDVGNDIELLNLFLVNGNEIYSLSTTINFQNGSTEIINHSENPLLYCIGVEPYGCTDVIAFNYNSDANTDDGSCQDVVEGCTDASAFNFDSLANTNDGSCIELVFGCTDNGLEANGTGVVSDIDGDGLAAFNYNSLANTNDGSCVEVVLGCVDNGLDVSGTGIVNDIDGDGLTAFNYNSLANTNDGSCIAVVFGCVDNGLEVSGTGIVNDIDGDGLASFNYNPLANTDNGTCEIVVFGCTDDNACNYNYTANTESNLCEFSSGCETCSGEIDGSGIIIDNDNDDDNVCDSDEILGCTDQIACNFDATPTTDTDNNLCIYSTDLDECASCSGEQDGTGIIIDNDEDNDLVCDENEVLGCDNSDACGNTFNPLATEDDGSCLFFDDCGICDGDSDCAIFIQDEIQITIDENLVSDVQVFSENFEDLLETQLGLAEGTVVVLDVTIDENNRGEVNVTVEYTITLTEGELEVSSFDSNLSFEEIKDQINLNILSIESGPVFSNLAFIKGCTDSLACNYNIEANIEDFNCINKVSVECDECSGEQDGTGVLIQNDLDEDGVCAAEEILGCTDNGNDVNGYNQLNDIDGDGLAAINYNPLATDDDGSCITQVLGCTDSNYLEYWSYNPDLSSNNPSASITNLNPIPNTDDGSCFNLIIYGCMDSNAINYDESANVDIPDGNDGACIPYATGCTNPNACNTMTGVIHVISECIFPPQYYECDSVWGEQPICINDEDGDGVCNELEIEGCTVSVLACNFNLETTEEVECIFADEYYDCEGNCINDIDSDGVCDELEIYGCTDSSACNFNIEATESEDVCIYPVTHYDCNSNCNNDSDGDQVCDENEVLGCTSWWATNYDTNATDDNGLCFLFGCTNANYFEYDANATTDDGTYCLNLIRIGCIDENACNYDPTANSSDNSCEYPEQFKNCDGSCINGSDIEGNCIVVVIEGCMDEAACNFNYNANTDTDPTLCTYFTPYLDCNGECYFDEDENGVCDQLEIFGCLDENACNYNSLSTRPSNCIYPAEEYLNCNNECLSDIDNDGICDQVDIESCGDELALNYVPFSSQINNDLCEYNQGCTDVSAANYDPSAIEDDGSCLAEIIGCTNNLYTDFDPFANINNQDLCITLVVEGCTDEQANNFDSLANFNNYDCIYDIIFGCLDPNYLEFNPFASQDSSITLCQELIVEGCTNSNFLDFNPLANVDNGDCQTLEYLGCLDTLYQEYNPLYTVNNYEDCINLNIYGCTSPYSQGGLYNPDATVDDGSCILIGCSDPTYAEYHNQGFIPNQLDPVFNEIFCQTQAVIGCTNQNATNYEASANVSVECIFEIDPNTEQYNFNYVTTGTSHSIILPYYGLGHPNTSSNVIFSGDITEPFPVGSTLGVFYTDYTNSLVCGGSTEWVEGSNQISAFMDDSFTPTVKDGFSENEPFIWFLLTPDGIFYEVTSIQLSNFSSGTNNYTPVANTFSPTSFYTVTEIETQFVTQYEVYGCMDSLYEDYNPYANIYSDNLTNSSLIDDLPGNISFPDGIDDDCLIKKQIGCTDPTAKNYDSNATEDNGTCYPVIYGCIDSTMLNYINPIGNVYVDPNTDDGSCYPYIFGCKDDFTAFNYIPPVGDPQIDVNTDDGSCYPFIFGCNDPDALNFNDYDGDGLFNIKTGLDSIDVNTDDGSCIPIVFGCTDSTMYNFNPLANVNNNVCYPFITGCVENETALNHIPSTGNPYLDVNDTVDCILPILGCMDPLAYNYDDQATVHDDSCIEKVYGCIDNGGLQNTFGDVNDLFGDDLPSFNYNPNANTDDGSCFPIIEGCMDPTAFNFNNYGNDKYISYELTDIYTNVNTPNNSCIEVRLGCLDINAYNYNDFDLDGESNASSDPLEKINTHLQSECFYRPGCTNQAYAQYWNYSLINDIDNIVYPDSMLNFESCEDLANFYCNNNQYVEHFIITGSFEENNFIISTPNNEVDYTLVPSFSECINIRIDYCSENNYEGYYYTNNIIDGSDLEAGANFPLNNIYQAYTNGNNLNSDIGSLCGDEVVFYCNDSSRLGYYYGTNVLDGSVKDVLSGNIIDNSLCGEETVDLYCSDSSLVGYYNVNINGDFDISLGHNSGNIIDSDLCGEMLIKYCDDPSFTGYYLQDDTVGEQYVGNIIDNNETCIDSAIFYCSDPLYLGHYAENYVQGSKSVGTHQDNSLLFCIEAIDPYCSDPSFFEYYIDYSQSLDPYIGNIIDDSLCQQPILPGCMDETMFNWDPLANVNRTTITDSTDPCYPIVYGCTDSTQFNYNNYYSSLNINPISGLYYQDGDLSELQFGPIFSQDSLIYGDGINVNTLVTDISSLYTGVCIPVVYGCTDPAALNYNDIDNDGISDSWNYDNPFINVNTDDGSCIPIVRGCTDSVACNYSELATVNDASCYFAITYYDCNDVCLSDTDGDGICDELEIDGCSDENAFNFNESATEDDGSCIEAIYGCTDINSFNYDSSANTNEVSELDSSDPCEPIIFGCLDQTAFNWNPSANTDDFSCVPIILGCIYEAAYNYNSLANTYEVGSCIPKIYGCTNPNSPNFDSNANTDNGLCIVPIVGCTNEFSPNYDIEANVDDGSCIEPIVGCTDPTAWNFDPIANYDNGTCVPIIYGCTTPGSTNYNINATVADGSCIPIISGCTDTLALNYNPVANINDGSCIIPIYGCMNPSADNFEPNANVADGSCFTTVLGCTDSLAINYNVFANTDDQSCVLAVYGCMNPNAFNYNIEATVADGSCIPIVYGCIDNGSDLNGGGFVYDPNEDQLSALNYNPLATTLPDGVNPCIPIVYGCMNQLASNYDANATVPDGSCISIVLGCTDSLAINYNQFATNDDPLNPCVLPVYGCMNPNAFNYNIDATVSDGSCVAVVYGCTDNGIETNGAGNVDDIFGDQLASLNYNPSANTNNGSCIQRIDGCMSPLATNYNPGANYSDESCTFIVFGCSNESALNYNEFATNNDGSCILPSLGCTNPTANNYDPLANSDDGSCTLPVYGCTDQAYLEYSPIATSLPDGENPCITIIVPGCTENLPWICNYNPDANFDDGSCLSLLDDPDCLNRSSRDDFRDITQVCIDTLANNYFVYLDPESDGWANGFFNPESPNFSQAFAEDYIVDNSICDYNYGCTDQAAFNFDISATLDDGSCEPFIVGCTDSLFVEFDPIANTSNPNLCIDLVVYGCMEPGAFNYIDTANVQQVSFEDTTNPCIAIQTGCNNVLYLEYNVDANTLTDNLDNSSGEAVENGDGLDDFCATLIQEGCDNSNYLEYYIYDSVLFTVTLPNTVYNYDTEPSSCINEIIYGCTNENYFEFNVNANVNDGSCQLEKIIGCNDPNYLEYDTLVNFPFQELCLTLAIPGCTDDNFLENYIYDAVNFSVNFPDPLYNQDDGSCSTLKEEGCTNQLASNYNSAANVDDGSCVGTPGCTAPLSTNYDENAVTDNGSCLGCTNPLADNYDSWAGEDNGLCSISGCMDSVAANYNPIATFNDGTCIDEFIYGCTDPDAFNFNSSANTNQVSLEDTSNPCIPVQVGCTESQYVEYWNYEINDTLLFVISQPDLPANIDDGSCSTEISFGCTDQNYIEYSSEVNTYNEDDCLTYIIYGCTNQDYVEFDSNATVSLDAACQTEIIIGCTNINYLEYNSQYTEDTDPSSCMELIVEGCTDENSTNFNSEANSDDGSCIPIILGCTDITAFNFNDLANTDDESCVPIILGCTDSLYLEFDDNSNTDDGTCDNLIVQGCTNDLYLEYDENANIDDNSCTELIIEGCTDSLFFEYYSQGFSANVDDNSCITEAIFGCTDNNYLEYYGFINATIPIDIDQYLDSLSISIVPNVEFNPSNCNTEIIIGCFNEIADNHNESVTVHDVTLCEGGFGCAQEEYMEYNPLVIIDNGSCITSRVFGCNDDGTQFLDELNNITGELGSDGFDDDWSYDFDNDGLQAKNYNPLATENDGSCYPIITGCFDENYYNYNDIDYDGHPNEVSGIDSIDINTNDSASCIPFIYGCTDSTAFNFDSLSNTDDGTCYPIIDGCMDPTAFNFNDYDFDGVSNLITTINGVDVNTQTSLSNCYPKVFGCLDSLAFNYNDYDYDGSPNPISGINGVDVNIDDGSCFPIVLGCLIDSFAYNFNDYQSDEDDEPNELTGIDGIDVNTDNGSCFSVVNGCMDSNAFNYNDYDYDGISNPITGINETDINTNDYSYCEYLGCTNFTASNYEDAGQILSSFGDFQPATIDDGSCYIPGCTLQNFPNYNSEATIEDGSCNLFSIDVYGCTNDNFMEFFNQGFDANIENGSCLTPVIFGCMDDTMWNYNEVANIDDASCTPFVYGCMDDSYLEYNTENNTPDTSLCLTLVIEGCTNPNAENYNPNANSDNGSCDNLGCTNAAYLEYNEDATIDDGSCNIEVIYGCTDSEYLEFWQWEVSPFNSQLYLLIDSIRPNPNVDDESCSTEIIRGCLYDNYLEYNPNTNVLDVSLCENVIVTGCTDLNATVESFNPNANVDDGSCQILGCVNSFAFNFNPNANLDDGSCVPFIYGCTVLGFDNFNPVANIDNGTCSNAEDAAITGCTNPSYYEYDPNATNHMQDYCLNIITTGCTDETMFNYNSLANIDDNSCVPFVYGCTNQDYIEYDSTANTDDESCQFLLVPGCNNPSALNYNIISPNWIYYEDYPNSDVNYDDGSCISAILGCVNSFYLEYHTQGYIANSDDGSCQTVYNPGCTDINYLEYYDYFEVVPGLYVINGPEDLNRNYNDGSCSTLLVQGCVYESFQEYNPDANISNVSDCILPHIPGCTNESAFEYDSNATLDNGTCTLIIPGCTDSNYVQFDQMANEDNGSCVTLVVEGENSCNNPNYLQFYNHSTNSTGLFNVGSPLNDGANIDFGCVDSLIYGCSYDFYVEFNPSVNVNDQSYCQNLKVLGCTDTLALNYNIDANTEDGSCIPEIYGCMDISYVEYNSIATVQNIGACSELVVFGCTDLLALNYNPTANVDNYSCIPEVFGCSDPTAFNYNVEANSDDGSCIEIVYGCTDNGRLPNGIPSLSGTATINDFDGDELPAFNYNPNANIDDESCIPIIEGCIDSLAFNYDNSANTDDGSCIPIILGCIDNGNGEFDLDGDGGPAYNYNTDANTDDGSCYPRVPGCLDSTAYNFNDYDFDNEPNELTGIDGVDVNVSGGFCFPVISGCTDPTAENYQFPTNNLLADVNTDDGSCTYRGCMDETADNYNPLATLDPPLTDPCQYLGCNDEQALNFDPIATLDDGSCIIPFGGCTDSSYLEFNPLANIDNGTCFILARYGCTDMLAYNYDASANINQVSFEDTLSNPCLPYIWGCTDNGLEPNANGEINDIDGDSLSAYNFNSVANSDDGSCIAKVYGCMNPGAINYNLQANINDGSCQLYIWGCTDSVALNYNSSANSDDGSCIEIMLGCMNPLAFNYDPLANTNSGSCISYIYGCTDESGLNYNANANSDDGSCIEVISGCMNPVASNYNSQANSNDGSCIAVVYGCTDSTAVNYYSTATVDNGTCVELISGCTNPFASNYNNQANQDDGSCSFEILGCTDESALNFDENATANDGSCETLIFGCTWSFASNFNPEANIDDGTCDFSLPVTIRSVTDVCIDPTAINYFAYGDPNNPFYIGESQLTSLGIIVNNEICTYASGCTDPFAFNYDSSAEIDDGSCEPYIVGCTDENYMEYNSFANTSNNDLCFTLIFEGCNNINATNYEPLANIDDGSCIFESIEGCTDPNAINFNENATVNDSSCQYDNLNGCSDPNYLEFGTVEDCLILEISGCTDPAADNYDQQANSDNNNCQFGGCTDPSADNFNQSANVNDGSCIWEGCTNSSACNYDNEANADDGSCNYPILYYDCAGECILDSDLDGVCDDLEILGCTDDIACNYNSSATDSDESCTYTENFYDCDGNCINDIDFDNVCDELEVEGCTDPQGYNYNELATDQTICDYDGCMNSLYIEYDPVATVDIDNACETFVVSGCTNELANNYDFNANQDDGSCNILGCTNTLAENYNLEANQDDGSCNILGCTDPVMFNYNSEANQNDGSCEAIIYGCMDSDAFNYNSTANTDDDNCIPKVIGCINPTSFNFNDYDYDGQSNPLTGVLGIDINTGDGSCIPVLEGCTDDVALNYDENVNTDDGSCVYPLFGCTNSTANNYNPNATDDDGSCIILGCTSELAVNYDSNANQDDDSCIIYGCTLENFPNYNPLANTDDASCDPSSADIFGCMDDAYLEYDPTVTNDNGSCETLVIFGCMDSNAFNYSPSANTDGESCIPVISGCLDEEADNYNDYDLDNISNELTGDSQIDINTSNPESCIYYGCTLEAYPNYDPTATFNDGSCDVNSSDIFGCTDENYLEYLNQGFIPTIDNGTCLTLIIEGCTNNSSINYNPDANVDDGSCITEILGCTDSIYLEYNALANTDDNTCETLIIFGCTDNGLDFNALGIINDNDSDGLPALNYDSSATVDDESCETIVEGCTDPFYIEYLLNANVDDGSCINEKNYGCTDPSYIEYWNHTLLNTGYYIISGALQPNANYDDGSCHIPYIGGCVADAYVEYNPAANVIEQNACNTIIVQGCLSTWADNYNDYDYDGIANSLTGNPNIDVNTNDSSCFKLGCMTQWADNYDELATIDDGSCNRLGCMSEWADNYDELATIDDESCFKEGCMLEWADNYAELATQNTLVENECYRMGCMWLLATNYDSFATNDDNSCYREGCMSEWADNTDPYYNFNAPYPVEYIDNGSCTLNGCMSEWADNYDINATSDTIDEFCFKEGCMSEWADNYDSLATIEDGSCFREGCISDWADNYDPLATIEDGSCYREGCTSEWADNYDEYATINDSSCELNACMSEWADNFDVNATTDTINGSCIKEGCISDWADNYDPIATDDDGSCFKEGCIYDWADNYDLFATIDDGSCYREGCMSEWANAPGGNYDSLATINNGLCFLNGCIYEWADNYNSNANIDDGSCYRQGCISDWADNYDPLATIDDGLCELNACMSDWADNYNQNATVDDGSCVKEGCTSDWADNFDELATLDNGTCLKEGCMSDWADNFDEYATIEDGSCQLSGCTDSVMFNYDSLATQNDGSCYPIIPGCLDPDANNYFELTGNNYSDPNTQCDNCCLYFGCMDSLADNYSPIYNAPSDENSCLYLGCTDQEACNWDNQANTDDGSCFTPELFYNCLGLCINDVDADGICDELEQYGCTDELAVNYDTLATENNESCYYPMQVDLVINNAVCKGGLGSVELNIIGGLEPIQINTFGLDITAIPPGDGYVIHVSDASGNDYSFGGSDYNFTPSFSITEPQEQLQLIVGYNQVDDQIYFATNADTPEFTWYFNNVADETITTDSFTPQENGVYGVDITDEFGCSLFEDILFESVSISELSVESIEVYPNPSNGWVNIKYDLPKKLPSTIRLISLTGKLINKIDLEANNRVEQLIPLFDLSAGIYMVEIEIDGKKLLRSLSIK